MKKSKFVKSVVILTIGGFITKIISLFIKIVLARLLKTEGMGIYMLISPTFNLLMAIASLGLPVAISKLVAEETKNNKNLVFSVIPISLLLNMIIILFLLITSKYISINLLNEKRCYYGLISIGFVLPFISISSILRGYFFGKQKMIPHVLSNITEDLVRLIFIIVGVPIFIKKGLEFAAAYVILVNIISELTSIIILFFFIPKNFKITKNDIKPNKKNIKDVFSIGLPTTASRIIGSVGFFLEPIIITFSLTKIGYSHKFIINEYGLISGYIMPLILLPSFFTLAISEALIPSISKAYVEKKYSYIKHKINQAIFLSLLIGIPATIIFEIIPKLPMKLIYNTVEGIDYLKVLAPIALLHYIQSPLTATLQAMGKAKEAMNGTIGGTIIRVLSLFLFSLLHIKMWSLIIAVSLNIIFVTLHQAKEIKKEIKKANNKYLLNVEYN
ncbi:MAG: polysaccharide biosynthesis protein [Bacilli bacterium]|nr:polysaccharide biosynthesis protein [Bacilli bacterium]